MYAEHLKDIEPYFYPVAMEHDNAKKVSRSQFMVIRRVQKLYAFSDNEWL